MSKFETPELKEPELKEPESIAISILDRKLEEVKDKLIPGPESAKTIFQDLLGHIQLKHENTGEPNLPLSNIKEKISSIMDTVEAPPETTNADPLSQLTGLFSSLMGGSGNNSLMGIVSQTVGNMQKFSVKKEDILEWRTKPEMVELLTIDPRARYMYLSPTPLLPSLSGLYLHIEDKENSFYVLFTSRSETPLVYSENILTRDFVEKVFQEESAKIDPMLRMMIAPQINQYLDIDSYWTFINPELDPKPVPIRRRPVYIEAD